MTFQKLIRKKKISYINPLITKKDFPLVNRGKGEYKLYDFKLHISSEDIEKEMAKDGFVPANINELLNWGSWNGKDRVVALGNVAQVFGHDNVAYLDRNGLKRILNLCWRDGGWSDYYRFLAFRPLSSKLRESEILTLGHFVACPSCGVELEIRKK